MAKNKKLIVIVITESVGPPRENVTKYNSQNDEYYDK